MRSSRKRRTTRLGISHHGVNMLEKKTKEKLIKKFGIHAGDTGSTPVQVAILTEEIRRLTEHLKEHRKDNSSRRGLLKKVSERRRLLKYYAAENQEAYQKLADAIGLPRRPFGERKEELDGAVAPVKGEKEIESEE